MSLLADALQPFIVRNFTALAGRPEHLTLPDVLVAPASAYDFDFDDADQSILLDFRVAELITAALAADCCRLASASFQTAASLPQEILQRDTVAWSLVKLYYAAFYAGHSIIRIFGESCSYFERQHVTRLNAVGAAYGRVPTFPVESGLYRCAVSTTATAIRCTKTRGGAGGSHESFWDVFGNLIRVLADQILLGPMIPREAQAAFLQIQNLRSALTRRSGHSWLSLIRNDIQYRHGFGVWFPAILNSRQRTLLSAIIRNWDRDPMNIDLQRRSGDLIDEFAAGCTFIIALCHAMLTRIADRSSAGGRSFVRFGPMMFLNDIRARAREQPIAGTTA